MCDLCCVSVCACVCVCAHVCVCACVCVCVLLACVNIDFVHGLCLLVVATFIFDRLKEN